MPLPVPRCFAPSLRNCPLAPRRRRITSPARLALALALTLACCGDDGAPVDQGLSPTGNDEDAGKSSLDGGVKRDASIDAARPASSDGGRSDGGSKSEASGLDAGGTTLPPFVTSGAPLEALDKKWTYLEFPDALCRDGSKAGIAVSLNKSSKKLMIFLEGGGACFDVQTCLTNPGNTSAQQGEKKEGVFDRSNGSNPVKDWNFVYVPYCTGDTHAGNNPNGMVDGVGAQKFVGYANMRKFLNRVVPTFKDATDVVLTGISAGGFGAAQNAVLVQRAFSNTKIRLVDDSGPPLSSVAIPECLQEKWRTTWSLDQTFLADCGAACPNKKDFAQDYGVFLARTFRDRASGLIESVQDGIISGFFGIGQNNCTGILLLTPVLGATFQAELLAFRDNVKPYPSFSTYFPTGTQHTWLSDSSFYTGAAGGTKLVDWFAKIVNNEVPGHVGP